MWTYIIIYILGINLISFIIMGHDKSMARQGARRIPEKLLFTLAAAGGSIGVYWGMRKFRHKTKHLSFQIGIPFLIILNATFVYFLATAI